MQAYRNRRIKKHNIQQKKPPKPYDPYCPHPQCTYKSMNSTRLKRHIQAHQQQQQPIHSPFLASLGISSIPPRIETVRTRSTSIRQPFERPVVALHLDHTTEVGNYLRKMMESYERQIVEFKSDCIAQRIYNRIEPMIQISLVAGLSKVVKGAIETNGGFTDYEETRIGHTVMEDISRMFSSSVVQQRSSVEGNQMQINSSTSQAAEAEQPNSAPPIKLEQRPQNHQ